MNRIIFVSTEMSSRPQYKSAWFRKPGCAWRAKDSHLHKFFRYINNNVVTLDFGLPAPLDEKTWDFLDKNNKFIMFTYDTFIETDSTGFEHVKEILDKKMCKDVKLDLRIGHFNKDYKQETLAVLANLIKTFGHNVVKLTVPQCYDFPVPGVTAKDMPNVREITVTPHYDPYVDSVVKIYKDATKFFHASDIFTDCKIKFDNTNPFIEFTDEDLTLCTENFVLYNALTNFTNLKNLTVEDDVAPLFRFGCENIRNIKNLKVCKRVATLLSESLETLKRNGCEVEII